MLRACLLCATYLSLQVYSQRGSWNRNGGYEYYASKPNESYTFEESMSKCHRLNSELAQAREKYVQQFITSLIKNGSGEPYSFYFGFRRADDGHFKWRDCTPGGNETHWNSGQPHSNTSKQCAVMGNLEQLYEFRGALPWYNVDCSARAGFICQRPVNTTGYIAQKNWPEPFCPKIDPVTHPPLNQSTTDPAEATRAGLTLNNTAALTISTTSQHIVDPGVLPILIVVPGVILLVIAIAAGIYIYKKRSASAGPSVVGFDNRMYAPEINFAGDG